MKVLVTGNGFDIAHKLKTSYKDFMEIPEKNPILFTELEEKCKISKNSIYLYFKKSFKELGWLGFEVELKNLFDAILSIACEERKRWFSIEWIHTIYYKDVINPNYFVIKKYLQSCVDLALDSTFLREEDYNKLLENFNSDFLLFKKAFVYYINKENERTIPKDNFFIKTHFDRVLTFNYTNTFERLYGLSNENICYVHGKVEPDKENIVLGIGNDYFDVEKHVQFSQYYKFFQRIDECTDNKFLSWTGDHYDDLELYIYGHSLDATDADILRQLIMTEGNTTTIYYLNKESKQNIIKNLTEMIGQIKLTEKFFSSNPSIILKECPKIKM